MKNKKAISVVLLAAIVSGCASYRPIVDMQGVDRNRYDYDLKECQGYAAQVNPGNEAAAGAVAGALFGALLGVAIGGRRMAGYGAGIGTAQGLGTGAAVGAGGQIQVVRNCMVGRGYRVLR